MKYKQTEAETEAKTMTVSDLQHAIDCAHDCDVGYQAAPYQAELARRNEQKIEAAELGAEWGLQEAGHQIEAVENGHQSEAAQWATGQWCGSNPYSRTDDATADFANAWEATLDRAAQAAYNAAIDAAQAVQSVLVTIADCGTTVRFAVTGPTVTVIECGGCPVEHIFLGKLDSRKPETMDHGYIRDIWVCGYDGDPEANGLQIEVEYEAAIQAAQAVQA